jgi:tetratricopeptide (TPR) repeat protein
MTASGNEKRPGRPRPAPVVTPGLKRLLFFVFGLFSLLAINAAYLASVTWVEWLTGETIQNYFYQLMFLGHLVLGVVLIVPFIIYGIRHMQRAWSRPNRRAVRVGVALFVVGVALLVTGLLLTRGIPLIEIRDPLLRQAAYWVHLVAPVLAIWLFVLHRLAGPRINWRLGGAIAAGAVVISVLLTIVQAQDPRRWNAVGPDAGVQYFFPSLARTASGDFIPARALMQDAYCQRCHQDVHESWSNSVHRFASFNNPAYLFSVRNTREKALARDGDVQAARFCAGCHDPVPFFSGAFDDPQFDDVGHPTAQAGITCSVCHAVTNINSPRGNADYTIEEPLHYPFAYATSPALRWVNETLVKAKPEFHRKTFLKPLHRTAEFCGACHKVHLPEELNGYRWLRGQNHYDSFLLSGVSGHGIRSFYYPEAAEPNCNGCHMPTVVSSDFGARRLDDSGELKVHDHQFPSANTGIPHLLGLPEAVNDAHRAFLRDALRVDIFGLKEGGTVEGRLHAPLRPDAPAIIPGQTYLLETVLRTLSLGHLFTQGTADSNQIWVDVTVSSGGRILGRSGAMEPSEARVDPWAHFVNAWILDREGRRIDRRNAEDIFTALYNNQIPPGAADVVHYRFTVPGWVTEPVQVEVSLKYRKFDTHYLKLIQGEHFVRNDLPVTVIASDSVSLPVAPNGAIVGGQTLGVEPWQRWNDYGIGLLRKGGAGELRQAETAFRQVEALGSPHGAVNLARVYLREGRLEAAAAALERARGFDPPAYPWSVTYFTAVLNRQNGFLDEAIEAYRTLVDTRFNEARTRGFDFSRDYRLLNELGGTLLERSKLERGGDDRSLRRAAFLIEAETAFNDALAIDPENEEAHWGLTQVYGLLNRPADAQVHLEQHARYKVDDNARDRAIAAARRANPAANHAAEAVVIYDLQRPGNYGLADPMPTKAEQ